MQESDEMVGGSAWLNLINTVCLQNGDITDRLEDDAYFAYFLLANELCEEAQIEALQAPERKDPLRSRMRELRSFFFDVIDRLDAGRPMTEAQASALSAFVNGIAVEYAFVYDNPGTVPHFHWQGKTLADQILLQLVNSFTTTIETVALERIRKCEHEQCILHFVDTSKAGKRRWCSMNTCGNRVKASTFYSKHKRKGAET